MPFGPVAALTPAILADTDRGRMPCYASIPLVCMRRLFLLLLVWATWPVRAQTWEPVPGPYGGTVVEDLVATADGTLLAATQGGVFRSADGGATWSDFSEGLTVREVRALYVLPDGTLLAGTFGDGLYQRAPTAAGWTATSLRLAYVTALARSTDGTLFAGTTTGLYRSQDGGATWPLLATLGTTINVQALALDVSYLFLGTATGIYRSADGGETWTFTATGMDNTNVTSLAVNAQGTVFAGTNPVQTGCTVFRSRNHGNFWSCIQPTGNALQVHALAVDASGVLQAGGYRQVYRTSNEGDSWTTSTASTTTIYALLPTASATYAGTFGRGVTRSQDAGKTWQEVNHGLTSAVTDLVAGSDQAVYAGTVGGVYRSADRGNTWTLLDEGLGLTNIKTLAFDADGRLVAGTLGGVWRWDGAENRWEALGPDGNPGIRDLALGPDGRLYAGFYQGVYQLAGTTWTALPVVGPDAASRDVQTVAVTPAGTLLVGALWDAFRSHNGGASWTLLSGTFSPFFEAQAFGLAPSGRIYAGTRYFGVVQSFDGGLTWSLTGGGLPELADVRTFAFNPQGTVYAGTFGSGVVRLDPVTAQWVAVNEGLGNHLRVPALAFDAEGNGYAGTFGGGLFRALVNSTAFEPEIAPAIRLHGNYPNPFQTVTTLDFDLPAPSRVAVTVYDVRGRVVLTLPPVAMAAGLHRTRTLDAAALPAGLYCYRLAVDGPRNGQAVGWLVVVR